MEDNLFNDQEQENNTQEGTAPTKDEVATEVTHLKEQLIRLGADFQNYKKRVEKDRLMWTQSARADVLLQLLPVVDDFDRAMQEARKNQTIVIQSINVKSSEQPVIQNDSVGSSEQRVIQSDSVGSRSLNQFFQGFELIHKALYDYLKKNGVTAITEHTTFNPELHEAVMQSQVEGKQEGEIIAVLQQGFMCNGVVLRHSKVSVAC